MKQKIILATHNKGKIAEFKAMFANTNFEVAGIDEYPEMPDVEETGLTFEENAQLKSRAICKYTGLITMADDSGLSVDALGGAPGVYSARYSAENGLEASTERNNAKLLEALKGLKGTERKGQFVCVISVSAPNGAEMLCKGLWEGTILEEARGTNGFGYDPLLFIAELGCSAAELAPEQKNKVSHRGQALQELIKNWADFYKKASQ